jgi:hypothetical protein
VVASFKRAFGKDVQVIPVDTVEADESAFPFTLPDVIPSFMVLESGKKPRTFGGRDITVGQLASWVFRD